MIESSTQKDMVLCDKNSAGNALTHLRAILFSMIAWNFQCPGHSYPLTACLVAVSLLEA